MTYLLRMIIEKVFLPFVVVALIAMIIAFPFVVFRAFKRSRSPTFDLKKDEWSCTQVYEYTTTQTILVGKVMIPQTITRHDCVQWSHK